MWERFTVQARRAVFLAQEAARGHRARGGRVGPEHLVYGVLSVRPDCAALRLLQGAGVDPEAVCGAAADLLGAPSRNASADAPVSLCDAGRAAIRAAGEEAEGLGHGHIGTGHLLLGATRGDATLSRLLAVRGVYASELRSALRDLHNAGEEGEPMPTAPAPAPVPTSAEEPPPARPALSQPTFVSLPTPKAVEVVQQNSAPPQCPPTRPAEPPARRATDALAELLREGELSAAGGRH